MTDREVMKLALEALEVATTPLAADRQEVLKAQQALRQALAQHDQQPVAWMYKCGSDVQINTFPSECYGDNWIRTPLYTRPISEPVKERISETVAFEDWVKGQHAMPGDIGFRQALKTAYEAGAKIHGVLISEPVENLEPVAYWNGKDMFKRADEVQYVVNWTDYYHYPLYSEPRSCPTCESLARTVMMDQTSHDTAPPKREWVGLTDEEIKAIYLSFTLTNNHSEPSRFVRAIEAKLKEKNT